MSDTANSGIEHTGGEKKCQNCGIDFPKKPVSVGLSGLQFCPVCDEPTALGRSKDTGTNRSENTEGSE